MTVLPTFLLGLPNQTTFFSPLFDSFINRKYVTSKDGWVTCVVCKQNQAACFRPGRRAKRWPERKLQKQEPSWNDIIVLFVPLSLVLPLLDSAPAGKKKKEEVGQ